MLRVWCLIFVAALSPATGSVSYFHALGFSPQDGSPASESSARECNSHMFAPNYAEEIGAFQGGSWAKFPIRVWIDGATVRDKSELDGLQKGLRSWSEATGGVLGVSFTDNRMRAQVEVKMVDRLPGGRRDLLLLGLSTIQSVDGVTTGALLQIVHPSPAVLRVMGTLGNVHLRTALLTQRIAAHEMGHVLMGTADRHPSASSSVLQQDNITVMLPGAIDVNTAKAKYCTLFSAGVAAGAGARPGR
jgi:hypothetical protein